MPQGAEPALIQLYEQLLTGLLRAGVTLGAIVIALAAQGMIRQGRAAQLVIILLIIGLVALVSVCRWIDYRLRCGLWLLSLYCVGVVELIYLGFASTTQVYLAGFTLCTAILLNYKPRLGLGALALSVATIVAANALAFAGYFVPIGGPPLATTLPQIFVRGLLFLLVVGTCQAGIGILLHQLRASWRREQRAREHLELRVAERTSELAAAHAQLLAHSRQQAEQQEYLAALHQITLDLLSERDVGALLQAIVERAALIVRVQHVVLMLEDQGELVVRTFTAGQSLYVGQRTSREVARVSWRAFETRQPVVISDYLALETRVRDYDPLAFRGLADLPVLAGQRCLGVLSLARTNIDQPFTPVDLEQALMFAQLAAVVIDNAQLYATALREADERKRAEAALQRHAAELSAAHAQTLEQSRLLVQQQEYLTALHQTTVELLNQRELTSLLQALVERAASILDASYALVVLERGGELITMALTAGLPSLPGTRAERGVAIFTWQCYETGQPVIVDNYTDRPDRNKAFDALGFQAIAHIPILAGSRCLGVLVLNRTRRDLPFTQADLERARTFAQLAAVVIDNARLYDAAQREAAERAQAEQALQHYTHQLERHNTELDAFAHTVAHDLKNPLTSLIGYAELLDHNYALFNETQARAFLGDITRMGHKMTHIINDLLLFANVHMQGNLPVSALAMDEILIGVELRLQVLIQSSRATLVQPECWPAALGYAPWVEEVWMNYISNALKYGGDPPLVILGAASQSDGVTCFWVDDNGPGLALDEREQVFAPFTRLHTQRADGHGLGLSIVQRIVTRLGGEVGVEEAPGQGSRFFFTLPAAPAQPE